MTGKFITFEGGEGAGKTTQTWSLAEHLEARGLSVVLTREPGGGANGADIRKLLLEGELGKWSPEAETLLFFADRDDHLRTIIRPALAAGKWVICDRFTDSTVAYQGAQGHDIKQLIDMLDNRIVGETRPDLTFVLDLDPAVGLERACMRAAPSNDKDRFEGRDMAFHLRLRAAFVDIAKAAPKRCHLIDGAKPSAVIEAEIRRIVTDRFSLSAS